jgi:hypothetical protein
MSPTQQRAEFDKPIAAGIRRGDGEQVEGKQYLAALRKTG